MLPRFTTWRALLLCAGAATVPYWGLSQSIVPQSGEISFGSLPGDQVIPALSLSAGGEYLVWQDNTIDGHGTGIAAVRLDETHAPSGSPFRLNARAQGDQRQPRTAGLATGGAVVVWEGRSARDQQIYARFLRSDGRFLGSDLQVSPSSTVDSRRYRTNHLAYRRNKLANRRFTVRDRIENVRTFSGHASAVPLPDGGAMVVYHSARQYLTNSWTLVRERSWNGRITITNDVMRPVKTYSDAMLDVSLQRLSPKGQKAGSEVRVNQFTQFNQRHPSAALLANGTIIVVWVSEQQRREFQVDLVGRLFSAEGEPLSDEVLITDSELAASGPSVAALADGGFVVTWSQQSRGRSRWDVYGQAFTAEAAPASEAFRVNGFTDGDQFGAQVASIGNSQLVVWTSRGQDGSAEGVYARVLVDGALSGNEFRVNTTTLDRQIYPSVAGDSAGRFLVAWSSLGEDLSTSFDLVGRRYASSAPPPSPGASPSGGGPSAGEASQSVVERGTIGSGGGETGGVTPSGGAVVQPRIEISGRGEKIGLRWTAVPGLAYQVQVSSDLKSWVDHDLPRVATSGADSTWVENTGATTFFRVIQLQPR